MEWTIDTNVLGLATRTDMAAVEFLSRVQRLGGHVVFDTSGYIEGEYQRCLDKAKAARKPGADMVRVWLREILDKNQIRYVWGTITKKQKDELIKLRFHDDDVPFVEACARSLEKQLATDDSDYSEEIKKYLLSELRICARCYKECLDGQ
jgi:hypothetical protein